MKKGLWVWGYVLDKIPGEMQFVNGKTYCSLETGADYFGVDNVVYLNSMHDIKALDDKLFRHIERCNGVICALQHGNYLESAQKLSRFAQKHKNIKGAIIDDFLMSGVSNSSSFKPDDLKKVYAALKKENPELKLYVVRYTWQDPNELLPYLNYFDALNMWVWVSSEHFWQAEYSVEINRIKKFTGKPVIQGLFVHNYGETWHTSEEAVSMNITQLQLKKSLSFLREGGLEGCIILQNGWFCRENHREQIQWMKNYADWFYSTTTWRE